MLSNLIFLKLDLTDKDVFRFFDFVWLSFNRMSRMSYLTFNVSPWNEKGEESTNEKDFTPAIKLGWN